MKINRNIRNIAIVLALAVIVDLVSGAQQAANTILQAISLAFLALLAWIASRVYCEHRHEIDGLGTKHKRMLYVALGVIAVTLTASPRLDASAGGTLALIVLLVGSASALYTVYSAYRQY